METIFQLALAAILGGLVGLEREYKKKQAGLRTFALVSLGAAIFTIISFKSFYSLGVVSGVTFDPSRVIGQIVVGIGFIGAGLIIYRESRVGGLTTAAGLWTAAAIGTAVGAQFYWIAFLSTILAIIILAGLRMAEERMFHGKTPEDAE